MVIDKIIYEEDVKNAIALIKDYCDNRLSQSLQCDDCPFFQNCVGDNLPLNWEIKR